MQRISFSLLRLRDVRDTVLFPVALFLARKRVVAPSLARNDASEIRRRHFVQDRDELACSRPGGERKLFFYDLRTESNVSRESERQGSSA